MSGAKAVLHNGMETNPTAETVFRRASQIEPAQRQWLAETSRPGTWSISNPGRHGHSALESRSPVHPAAFCHETVQSFHSRRVDKVGKGMKKTGEKPGIFSYDEEVEDEELAIELDLPDHCGWSSD